MTNAVKNFIRTNAVGQVEYRSQSVVFTFANGRTGHLVLTEDGRFDGAMAYRGDNCVGSYSSLKSFATAGK